MRSDLKLAVIVSGGRNGSLFFQSLLDRHPQILQLPGIFYFDDFLADLPPQLTPEEAARVFTKTNRLFFHSEENTLHRMGQLGEEQNQYFTISEDTFVQNFSWAFANLDLSESADDQKWKILLAIHYAYAISSGDTVIDDKRVLVLHIHHAWRLACLKGVEPTVIFCERDPLPSLLSELKTLTSVNPIFAGTGYKSAVRRKLMALVESQAYGWPTYVLRLEDLHRRTDDVFRHFMSLFDLDASDTLYQSTFLGLKWWGDQYTGRFINGLNPEFQNKIAPGLIAPWEARGIEAFMLERIQHYGYPIRFASKQRQWRLIFWPSRIEISALWACLMGVLFTWEREKRLLRREQLKMVWRNYRGKKSWEPRRLETDEFPEVLGSAPEA